MPWSLYRSWALGVLGWSPDVFANSTLRELTEAVEMYRQLHGNDDHEDDRMTLDEFEALKERYPDQVVH